MKTTAQNIIAMSLLACSNFAFAADSGSSFSYIHNVNGLSKPTPASEPIQELDYWMFSGDFDGFFPAISDGASTGINKTQVNFGQTPFVGDPKGYPAYDPNYDPTKWTSTPDSADMVTPGSLRTAFYQKTHSSGKYYFEAKIVNASAHDMVGLSPTISTGQSLNHISGSKYMGHIGYANNATKTYGVAWANYRVFQGHLLQVWVDFDNNLLLVQKLGTTIDDHINPITR